MSKFFYSQSNKREADYNEINKSKCNYRSGWDNAEEDRVGGKSRAAHTSLFSAIIMKNLKTATHTKKVSF